MTGSVRLPVHRRDWVLVGTAVRRVLARPRYVAVALLAAALCLTMTAVVGNGALFLDVVLLGRLPLANRLAVLVAMYPFGGSVEPWAATADVALALLVGVDVALLAASLAEHGSSLETGARGSMGLAGALVGGVGAGCAVCGTSLLAGLLSFAGVGAAAVLLPFDGVGLTLLALGLLLLSSFWIADGMDGDACRSGADGPSTGGTCGGSGP